MKLPQIHPDPLFTTEFAKLGRLSAFPLTLETLTAISRHIDKCSSEEYIDTVIESIIKRNDGTSLSKNDIQIITSSEKELFVEKFVKLEPYIHTFTSKFGLSRQDGESFSDYAFRIMRAENKTWKESTKKIRAGMFDVKDGPITKALELITKPALSERLIKQISAGYAANTKLNESISRVVDGSSVNIIPNISYVPPPTNPMLDSNRHLQEINERLHAMENMAVEMARTVSAVSDTSSQFVLDFSKASGDANKAAITAAFIALLGVLAAVGQIFYSAYVSRQQEPTNMSTIASITHRLDSIADLQKSIGNTTHQDAERLHSSIDELSRILYPRYFQSFNSNSSIIGNSQSLSPDVSKGGARTHQPHQ